jgi:sporulation protein YlmC with PRC-barrel domain
MSMRIDLGAKVRTSDGEDAGTLERAVFDPRGNAVREFVVDTGGLLGRQVLVPAAELEAATREGDILRLGLSKKELEQLPTYAPERYNTVPPNGWRAPVGLGFPDGAYLWPAALITPAPAEVDVVAPPTERPVRPEGADVSLARGAAVLDRSGEDVGVVDEVRLHEVTGAVQGFTLRVGGALRTLFGGGDVVEVTRSQTDSVDESLVRLRLSKDELIRLAREGEGGRAAEHKGEKVPEPQGEAGVGAVAGMLAGAAAGGAAGGPVGAVLGGGLGAAVGAQAGQEVGEKRDERDERRERT